MTPERWQQIVEAFETAIELTAAKSNDGIGPAYRPEHARLLQAATDDRFTTRLNHSGTDEEMLATKLRIAHTFGIALKVLGFPADDFG